MNYLGVQENLIESTLDSTARRQRVLATNIANTNTPGYKAKEVAFDRFMGKAVIRERKNAHVRADGNSVNMETERAELQKNALVHRLFLQVMFAKASQMKSAIRGSGG